MPALLLILTAADHWTLDDGTRHPTGFWAEELVAPMRVFREAGVDGTIATPGGARPTVDEGSLSPDVVAGEERPPSCEASSTASPIGSRRPWRSRTADRASWLLEDRIREAGGRMRTGPAWQPLSVVDGDVVTGQNPASSTEVANDVVQRLDERSHRVHVVPHEGGWPFEHERGDPEGHFATQREAERAAKEHARAHGDWEVIIHDRRGRIRDSDTMDRAHESPKPDRVR